MARSARIKRTSPGVAHYHVMSRTNGRRFLFEKGRVRTELVDALRRAAEFSGVELKAYVAMSNHFHAVVRIVRPECPVSEDELVRRVGVLSGASAAERLADRWRRLRQSGSLAVLAAEQDRLRRRMGDVSEFVKTFKETFDLMYKRENSYCGSIWAGRFVSTLVEDGEYLSRSMRYVFYNPVRAGMVARAGDYPWGWCGDVSRAAGPVPGDGWLRGRVAQIGAGKIFGSEEFVRASVLLFGDRFKARTVFARQVGEIGFATHGWKLAALTRPDATA